jgi:aminopeptidase Y
LGAALLSGVMVLAACGIQPPSPLPDASGGSSAVASAAASGGAVGTPAPLPSLDLGGEVSADAVRRHLDAFDAIADAHGGSRAAGTPGYEASVDYVAAELTAMGYEVGTPQFEVPTFSEVPGGRLSVLDGGPAFESGEDMRAMIYSTDGDLTARVATVGFPDSAGGEGERGCDQDDWDEFPTGRIALTPPGNCFRRDMVEHAQEAGAVALVVANENWEQGEMLRPTLLFPDGIDIPAISATGELGQALLDAAETEAEVRIQVDTTIGDAPLRDVIAQHGSGEPVVMLGAHLDSVLDGPGLNDNASGTAAVLEIAHLLADAGHPGTVRVGLWAAEEFGLHGSRGYVTSLSSEDIDAISAYINLDMLGSVNAVPMVYANSGAPEGSAAISEFLLGWLQAAGVPAEEEDLSTGSDHFFFAQAGIPIGGIFSGASELMSADQAAANGGQAGQPMDPCYHLACDTIENVDVEQVATYAQAAAAAAMAILQAQLAMP